MSQLFIQNTEPRLHVLCVVLPSEGPGLKPRRTNIELQPGVNPVEKLLWEKALEVKANRGLVAEGKLKELGPTQNGNLSDLKEPEARRIIGETYAIKLLKQWFVEESRPQVRLSIQKRLDEIEKESKPETTEKKPGA